MWLSATVAVSKLGSGCGLALQLVWLSAAVDYAKRFLTQKCLKAL